MNRLLRYLKPHRYPTPDTEELGSSIDEPFRAALLSMYRREDQVGADGQTHALDGHTKISASQGKWIYDLCCSLGPTKTLEIGLGYGFSALFFLAAIAKNKCGHHTAVDPFQHSVWRGIGTTRVHAVGMESDFTFTDDYSARAATDLARRSSTFDLIFIDGGHRFDDVLTDFYLYAPLCKIGGQIIFDDVWMQSIQAVIAFVRTNRTDFSEVRTSQSSVAVFKRISDDARPWDHFQPFALGLQG